MSTAPRHIDTLVTIGSPTLESRPRLRAAVETAQREDRSLCVVHLDLDRFHQVTSVGANNWVIRC